MNIINMLMFTLLSFSIYTLASNETPTNSNKRKLLFDNQLNKLTDNKLTNDKLLMFADTLNSNNYFNPFAFNDDIKINSKPEKAKNKIQQPIIIAEASETIIYIDFDNNIVNDALNALRSLVDNNKPITISQSIHNHEALDVTYNNLRNAKFEAFIPLIRAAIEAITQRETPNNKITLHIALRIDTNCNLLGKDKDRNFTQGWHNHGEDDRYVFTLTENDALTTMIKENDEVEKYTQKNTLFFLPGPMMHRTPNNAAGKRIQFSISVGSVN